MVLRRKTKERLQKAISAFKLEDFYSYVLEEFRQVSPNEISRIIRQNRLQASKKQITSLFLNLLLSHDIDNEECERSIVHLQIQAVALRPESRQWKALQLTGEPDNYGFTDSHVEDLVSRSLRRKGIETITRAVHHSSAFWINITVKKVMRRAGIVLQSPIFCVFYHDHPFLFISKSNVAVIEVALVEAFGFVEYRQCKLTGRDPISMLTILLTKDVRPEVTKSVAIDSAPLVTSNGLDFTEYHKRSKYMEQLFPSDVPKLSEYSVECKEAPWHIDNAFPEMGDSAYPLSLHLRTKDTIGMFKALAEEGLLEVPVPSYVTRALSCARNKVRVRANRDMSLMDQTAYSNNF